MIRALTWWLRIALLTFTTASAGHVHAALQWTALGGPAGGSIVAMASSGASWYVGTEGSGVFKSIDGGVSWQPAGGPAFVTALAADGNGTVFAGGRSMASAGTGLHRSTDGGATWTPLNNGVSASEYVNALYVDGGTVFASVSSNVKRSSDGGNTWTGVNDWMQLFNVNATAFAKDSAGGLYLSHLHGVKKSTDGGATWANVAGFSSWTNPVIASDSTGRLFAVYNSKLFVSTDDGTTWPEVTPSDGTAKEFATVQVFNDTVYVGKTSSKAGLLVSSNAGDAWTDVDLQGQSVKGVHVNAAGDLLAITTKPYTGTDHHRLQISTDDGSNWQWADTGINASHMPRMVVAGTHLIGMTTKEDVWVSTDAGVTWTIAGDVPGEVRLLGKDSLGRVYAFSDLYGIYRSDDDGVTWSHTRDLMLNGSTATAPVGFAADGAGGIYISGNGTYKSTDGGTTWTPISVNIGLNIYSGRIAVSGDGTKLMVGTSGQVVYSDDSGSTWNLGSGPYPNGNDFQSLGFGSGNKRYAGMSIGGVALSIDGGATWAQSATGMGGNIGGLPSMVVDPQERIFVGAPTSVGAYLAGLWVSEDQAASWTHEITGLEQNHQVSAIDVVGNQVYAAIKGAGVYKATLAAAPANTAPVADAGSAQTVTAGATVSLDASASTDADSDPLSYSWTQVSGTGVTLANAISANASFTAPNVATTEALVFSVTVDDGQGGTASAQVTVSVNPAPATGGNTSPVASAGNDQTVLSGASVNLNAGASSDTDGDTLSYSWSQVSGPGVNVANGNSAMASFTAPPVVTPTVLVFSVTVDDGQGGSATDQVAVTVNPNAPVAPGDTDGPGTNGPGDNDDDVSNDIDGDDKKGFGLGSFDLLWGLLLLGFWRRRR